jgi:hypothetical protein
MIILVLSDVIYNFYERGRPNAATKTFDKEDIREFVKMALSNEMVKTYYTNKQLNEGEEYYITSPLLSVQRFELGKPNSRGMRRLDMKDFDLFRLPKNSHITNAFPVGCGGTESKSITIVDPGMDYYYNKPKFRGFEFGYPSGRGLNTFNIPACAKFMDVESTFSTDEIDVSLDVAYRVSVSVLGTMLNVPFFMGKNPENTYAEPHAQLRQNLRQQQQQNAQV